MRKLDSAARWRLAFGCRLRTMRENRGMSRDDLARSVGVSYETVRSWEYAKVQPRAEMVAKLCNVLGASGDVLLGLEA